MVRGILLLAGLVLSLHSPLQHWERMGQPLGVTARALLPTAGRTQGGKPIAHGSSERLQWDQAPASGETLDWWPQARKISTDDSHRHGGHGQPSSLQVQLFVLNAIWKIKHQIRAKGILLINHERNFHRELSRSWICHYCYSYIYGVPSIFWNLKIINCNDKKKRKGKQTGIKSTWQAPHSAALIPRRLPIVRRCLRK